MTLILFAAMLVLFVLGMPVAFVLGASAAVAMVLDGRLPLATVPQKMAAGVDNFPLLAIPFFIMAGSLMNTGGMTKRLVEFASTLVGHITGGLAHVVIVANMVMAGMSGSAVADASGTGNILIPAMVRAGYSSRYAAAITAAASTIGPIIPPSIGMVIYGSIAEVSVGRLFIGGVIPGILMGLYLMAVTYLIARRRGYGRRARAALAEVWQAFRRAILPLGMPVIILGGIFGGLFTPTEAAVVASVYALAVGVALRELRWPDLARVGRETVFMTATVLFIVATSSVGGWLLAYEQVPADVAVWFSSLTTDPLIVLIILNVVFLVLGFFVDSIPIMIVMVPVLLPLLKQFGLDPVHFGVMMMLNLMIGLVTPPVGMAMYVACAIAKVSIADFTRECWPMIGALLIVLALITVFPSLVLVLPNLLMGTD